MQRTTKNKDNFLKSSDFSGVAMDLTGMNILELFPEDVSADVLLSYGMLFTGKKFNGRKPTSNNANELLGAFVHPQIRDAIDSLEQQMNAQITIAKYSADTDHMLFCRKSHSDWGLYIVLSRALCIAHPNYHPGNFDACGMSFYRTTLSD